MWYIIFSLLLLQTPLASPRLPNPDIKALPPGKPEPPFKPIQTKPPIHSSSGKVAPEVIEEYHHSYHRNQSLIPNHIPYPEQPESSASRHH